MVSLEHGHQGGTFNWQQQKDQLGALGVARQRYPAFETVIKSVRADLKLTQPADWSLITGIADFGSPHPV